jgi:hypothetical protein
MYQIYYSKTLNSDKKKMLSVVYATSVHTVNPIISIVPMYTEVHVLWFSCCATVDLFVLALEGWYN